MTDASVIAIFFAFFFATFVSEDAACVAAGAAAASGEISLAFAVAACFAGIVAGDLGLYWTGRIAGRRLLESRIVARFVSSSQIERGSIWLNDRGMSAVFVSRFVTGLRLPTYLAAGILKTDFAHFTLYFVIAAAIWTPIIVGSVAYLGAAAGGGTIAVAIAVLIIARLSLKLTTWRGRRLLIGRVRRVMQWEFWPLWIFYLPVVIYVLALAIRHRSASVFSYANPSIPGGGFAGESKGEIYRLIATAESNHEFLLRHRRIDAGLSPADKLAIANAFTNEYGLDFPIIVKPDAGERGRGVQIVEDATQLALSLAESDHDLLIQEYFDGNEASVFYIRRPGDVHGRIFSMTEKVMPTVVGDGRSTLEELILRDERAVCMAEKYLEQNRLRLRQVPVFGEIVELVRIGTHSRGAIFLDGEHLQTAELENAIDEICRSTPGFYFGRFDIRYSSADEFRRGRNFKIIELNGVTSESTNIYDPRYSLLDAYRILFRQWRIAFEIGVANKRRGERGSSLRSLLSAALPAIIGRRTHSVSHTR